MSYTLILNCHKNIRKYKYKMRTNINKKISIIGMGAVGAGIAYALMLKDIADELVFIDINEKTVNAEMLDIKHGIPNMGRTKITCGSYKDIKNSDMIIITAGRSRKSSESRLDLAEENIKITESIAQNIEKNYNKGVILIVANPVDIITYYLTKRLNLPYGKILGTGCILDTSRLINVIADYLKIDKELIEISVIGEHGNSQIPLWSNAKVAKVPLEEYCNIFNIKFGSKEKSVIESKVLNMGTEIITGKGKTFYGISTCVCYLAEAILSNKTVTANVTSIQKTRYGEVCLSKPSVISSEGINFILPLKLSKQEEKLYENSILAMRSVIERLANDK